MDDIPGIKVPDNLDSMSPREAWNACVEAHKPLIDWSLFWNDGRSIMFVKVKGE